MERKLGASSSLCVRAKKQQMLARIEWYANRSRMGQRSLQSCPHVRVFGSQTIWRARVYEALH